MTLGLALRYVATRYAIGRLENMFYFIRDVTLGVPQRARGSAFPIET